MSAPRLDWAVAERALPGQAESGDLSVVAPFGEGVLLAVVDGLGHGPEAAAAARVAGATLRENAGEALDALVRRCHAALLRTRGVVMTVAVVGEAELTWIGVGNVEGLLLRADAGAGRARESVMLRGGVVGYRLPPLRAARLPLAAGDTLVMGTDGIRGDLATEVRPGEAPRAIVDRALAAQARDADDALVLVARYLGTAP